MGRKTTILVFLIMTIISFCSAEVHFVTPQTESINAIIENAAPRDTVLLDVGVYSQRIFIGEKVLTLGSLDIYGVMDPPARERTIIDGMYLEDDGRALIIIHSSEVVLNGLSIINNTENRINRLGKGGGINIRHSDVTVTDCIISDHDASTGGAINARYSNTLVENCIIKDNHAHLAAGIYSSSGSIEIHNTTMTNNWSRTMDGGTLAIYRSSGGIYNSIIEDGYARFWAGGAMIYDCQDFNISENIWRNNFCGDESGAILFNGGDNINIINNIFDGNIADGLSNPGSHGGTAGAINARNIERMNIQGNTFLGNKSSGAVFLRNGDFNFRRNMFINNMGCHYVALSIEDYNGGNNSAVTAINNAFKYSRSENPAGYNNFASAVDARSGAVLTLYHNDFVNNAGNAIGYTSYNGRIIVDTNYYGHVNGPYHASLNPFGQGDTVQVGLNYENFASEPFWNYGLEFSQDVIDFGFVPQGTSVTENVDLTNTTENELRINYLNLFYENVFTTDAADSIILAPGESASIPITFQPESTINYFNVMSTVSTNQLASGSTIEIMGTGIRNTAVEENGFIPTSFFVSEPYPNPFNSQTRLTVFMVEPGNMNVSIYDICGRLVKHVTNGYWQRGNHEFDLDFSDQSSGIYFVRVLTGKENISRKMLLIR